MGTIMTPEQMIKLAKRLEAQNPITEANMQAADLIRQMAEPPAPDDETTLLRQALNRIEDMLLNDDGQAFKEARKFSDTLRARLDRKKK